MTLGRLINTMKYDQIGQKALNLSTKQYNSPIAGLLLWRSGALESIYYKRRI